MPPPFGLAAARRGDSQEACFLGGGDYREFLRRHGAEEETGEIVDEAGRAVGSHGGFWRFTPGQRRGLGVASEQRLYVVRIDATTNTVVLGSDKNLFEKSCLVEDVNLIGVARLEAPVRTHVKIRYATPAVPATVIPDSGGRLHIEFDVPQRALSPGQSAVLYLDDIVLGGGIIARAG